MTNDKAHIRQGLIRDETLQPGLVGKPLAASQRQQLPAVKAKRPVGRPRKVK